MMNKEEFEKKFNVRLVPKNKSLLMTIIGFFSTGFTKNFWTTYRLPFCKKATISYPPHIKDPMSRHDILMHEMVHVNQLKPWYGIFYMVLLYILLPFPVIFSGRWFIERPAFLLDIKNKRKTVEDAVDTLWSHYVYCWPKKLMRKWFLKNLH